MQGTSVQCRVEVSILVALSMLLGSGCSGRVGALDVLQMGVDPIGNFGLTTPRPAGARVVGLGTMTLCVRDGEAVTVDSVSSPRIQDGNLVAAGIRVVTDHFESVVSGNQLSTLGYSTLPAQVDRTCGSHEPALELMIVLDVTDSTTLDGLDVKYHRGSRSGVFHMPVHYKFCSPRTTECPE